MARPLPQESLIYERLKQQNVQVDAQVWEILEHHIRNDLFLIEMVIETSFYDSTPVKERDMKMAIERVKNIVGVISRLKEATTRENLAT